MARGNLDAQVKYLLGPLADPHFLEKAETRQAELARHWLQTGDTGMEAGSPLRRYLRFAEMASTAKTLRENYPAVGADPGGFVASEAVRNLPTVRMFSFLLAALSVDGRRTKPSASDLHDLRHMTYGLSRCDLVTADRRACALVRGRGLVPDGVSITEQPASMKSPRRCVESARSRRAGCGPSSISGRRPRLRRTNRDRWRAALTLRE